jgi:serine protease AprX
MRGLDWILHQRYKLNIQIVNISIGANDFETFHEGSDFVQKVNTLWDAGIVVVAAAGNKGPEPYTISAPGNSRKIITVGSSDLWHITRGKKIPAHSGAGPTLACIKKPDVVAPGSRIVSCAAFNRPADKRRYEQKSGTSMSTPIVSGGIALLLCRYPEMAPREVKIRLRNSSTNLHLPHEKQGWGLLNVERLLK